MFRHSKALLLALLLSWHSLFAQDNKIVAGPMLGQVELRSAQLWLQVKPGVDKVAVKVFTRGANQPANFSANVTNKYGRVTLDLTGLEPGSDYQYQVFIQGAATPASQGSFKTQPLWQWRTNPPDFSFLTGSCAYFNEPVYDRPGKPYGADSSIFTTMANEKNVSFMLWLGDNWYTREADYVSEWGLNKRLTRDRSLPVLQPFLKSTSHYAIWDDHDYGPNDADKSYVLKNASRNAFISGWVNPSYGEDGEGIYTKFTYSDVDFFLLDDRWFRSNDHTPDSIGGKVNPGKQMFGRQQMEWLKNALRGSNANENIHFRFIVNGSQVLNPVSPSDCLRHFSAEYDELMNFLADEKIQGVVFLTGDRHFSQVVVKDRQPLYPLIDITSSPLTSGSARPNVAELSNSAIALNVLGKQNYTLVKVTGTGADRRLAVEFKGLKGEVLGSYSIALNQITNREQD